MSQPSPVCCSLWMSLFVLILLQKPTSGAGLSKPISSTPQGLLCQLAPKTGISPILSSFSLLPIAWSILVCFSNPFASFCLPLPLESAVSWQHPCPVFSCPASLPFTPIGNLGLWQSWPLSCKPIFCVKDAVKLTTYLVPLYGLPLCEYYLIILVTSWLFIFCWEGPAISFRLSMKDAF